jgi:hypothetical protein
MPSSEKLPPVALVTPDVSEEHIASIIRVTKAGELGTASSPIIVTLTMEALRSSETSVLTRAIRRKIQEDVILHIWVFIKTLGS